MTLVTFKENIDHYVKGDVVDLDAAELKRVDAYAKEQDIKSPYAKGAKDVNNTTDTPSLQDQVAADSLKKGGKETGNDKTDNDDAGTLLKGDDEQTAADKLVENANRQAQGETLENQEGDNPTELDDSETVTDEDAGTEGVPVEDVTNEANRQAGAGDVEETGSDEESETETATELENDTETPAEGTDKAKPATAPKK